MRCPSACSPPPLPSTLPTPCHACSLSSSASSCRLPSTDTQAPLPAAAAAAAIPCTSGALSPSRLLPSVRALLSLPSTLTGALIPDHFCIRHLPLHTACKQEGERINQLEVQRARIHSHRIASPALKAAPVARQQRLLKAAPAPACDFPSFVSHLCELAAGAVPCCISQNSHRQLGARLPLLHRYRSCRLKGQPGTPSGGKLRAAVDPIGLGRVELVCVELAEAILRAPASFAEIMFPFFPTFQRKLKKGKTLHACLQFGTLLPLPPVHSVLAPAGRLRLAAHKPVQSALGD